MALNVPIDPWTFRAMSGLATAALIAAALFQGRDDQTNPTHAESRPERLLVGVEVDWRAGAAPGPYMLVGTPIMAHDQLSRLPVQSKGGETALQLERGAWSVQLIRPGFWAAPEVVVVSRLGQLVQLAAWPTGRVAGTFSQASEGVAPDEVTASFAPSTPSAGPTAASVRCTVEGVRWSCDVPAAVLDVQLSLPGYVTVYTWDQAIEPGKTRELEPIVLRRGASIVGWIESAAGLAESKGVTVGVASGLESWLESRSLIPATTPNRRGFFQLVDVPPGNRTLVARKTGAAPASLVVAVREGTETRLPTPIVLSPPAMILVTVDPPRGPDGRPWTVELASLRAGRPELVGRGLTTDRGAWSRSDLGSGQYVVSVLSSQGQKRWEEEIELSSGRKHKLAVRTATILVRGHVTLGDQPLPGANVSFGDLLSHARPDAQTNAEGDFELQLPRAGKWTVTVEAAAPPLHRSLADVEVELTNSVEGRVRIEISDLVIKGLVRDEAGLPARAYVRAVLDQPEAPVVSVESGEDGFFELRGMPGGSATLTAKTADGLLSDPATTIAVEGGVESQTVELIVRGQRTIRGIVLSPDGEVSQARIVAFPIPLGGPMLPQSTDANGRFELSVPSSARELSIAVSASGYGYKIVRQPVGGADEVVIVLDAQGGLLRFVLPDAEAILRTYVLHNGGFSGLMALRRWALQNGAGSQTGNVVAIPGMSSGAYTACIGSQADLGAALTGRGRAEGCASGTLLDGGELELQLGTAR